MSDDFLTDPSPFHLLGLEARPYLDPLQVDQQFRALAAKAHPDKEGGDKELFQQLHAASMLLSSPASRLRFLAGPSEQKTSFFSSEITTLFSTIASTLNKVDAAISSYHGARGALAKALLLTSMHEAQENITSLNHSIEEWKLGLEKELQDLDRAWPNIKPSELLALADRFTFCSRWEKELRERLLALEILDIKI